MDRPDHRESDAARPSNRIRRHRGEALSVACVAIGVAILIKLALVLFPGHPGQAFAIFEAAIAGTALWIGRFEGYLSLGLLAVSAPYFLLEGDGFSVRNHADALGLIGFVLAGLFLVTAIGQLTSRLKRSEREHAVLRDECAGKSALLSEMSHRVFNDLGSLTSLTILQARSAQEPETREALLEIADRIQIFAGVYKRLHADAGKAGMLDIGPFLEDLCADLRTAHLGIRPIALELDARSCRMKVARAALVGLVLNESIMNALKYAFPEDRSGTIRVRFGPDPESPGLLCLTVEDDGVGPFGTVSKESRQKGTGMGQRLLRAVASQLGGSYALERTDTCTLARLRFPKA